MDGCASTRVRMNTLTSPHSLALVQELVMLPVEEQLSQQATRKVGGRTPSSHAQHLPSVQMRCDDPA